LGWIRYRLRHHSQTRLLWRTQDREDRLHGFETRVQGQDDDPEVKSLTLELVLELVEVALPSPVERSESSAHEVEIDDCGD
jgi:hypothetical protein